MSKEEHRCTLAQQSRVPEAVVGLQLETGGEQAQVYLGSHTEESHRTATNLPESSKSSSRFLICLQTLIHVHVCCTCVSACVPRLQMSCDHCPGTQSALPDRTHLPR